MTISVDRRWFVALVLVAGGTACSEPAVEPGPPQHRLDACNRWCSERAHDPDCPSAAPGRTLDTCVQSCVSDEGATWLPDEDGEDQCAEEQVDLLECEVSLTCDERATYSQEVMKAMTSEVSFCSDELVSLAGCFNEHTRG